MELTKEQYDIIHSDGDVKINAVAGSGKTTTLISYAKSRDPNSKILYLAFNKTVTKKAVQKFAAAGIENVRIETAHSLALEHINKHRCFDIVPNYKNYELCDLLEIRTGDRMNDLILANHVNRFLNYFCNSRALAIEDLNYADT
ncbi:MAG TPA: UvrD-helicase domain-containing protein, partial [Chitinophagaceae bacterium]|nr:UvrD-helicase domain-containing protein [Chitinophagaceae bacterium]